MLFRLNSHSYFLRIIQFETYICAEGRTASTKGLHIFQNKYNVLSYSWPVSFLGSYVAGDVGPTDPMQECKSTAVNNALQAVIFF